ncbi:pentatricopeptide repeat-containing protein At5g14080-like [Silene latifolia]|uniref:pentatricopeptide repeat-containing protein At5g14080-like n=1 Tax=Silene latifolia TaxID=37657 RepID=UPI003D776C36
MRPPARELPTLISQALLTKSPTQHGTWTASLERTLHQLGCRDSLTPSLVARVIDPYLLHHPSLSLGFFNWAAQQPNFSHSSISYTSVLKSLANSRHFNSLVKVFKEAKARNVCVDRSVYRHFITSLVKLKRSHEGYLALSEVYDVGDDVCNLVLAGLVSEGRFEFAQKVFDEMLVRGVRFDTLGFGLFMWRYCRKAEISQVLGVLDRVRGRGSGFDGSIVALFIVHGLCDVGRISEAYSLLEELKNRDCKPDFIAYRIIAEAYRSNGPGCIFEVQMTLKKKRKLGVAPRASDYRDFILALLSNNFIFEGKVLGHLIIDGNFPVEDDVLDALVGSVSQVDPCSATLFFKFMLGKEQAPNLQTLSSLSRNLCKHGKIDDLLEVQHILTSKDYFTNPERYNVMFSSLCVAGRVREAYGILQEMRKKGLVPDISFYNILMEALCSEDLIRPAKKLWDEMFAYGVYGNLQTYNILIKKFAEGGQVDDAQGLYDHMLQKGITPNATTYTSLLEGLCQESKFEAAIQFFYKAADQDVTIARTIVPRLVLLLCKAGHFASASQFLCSNCHLGHNESHVILLNYLADAREFQIAINHLRQVMAVWPALLQEISTEIFSLLSSSSNPEPILQLLREMQQTELTSTDENWRRFCGQMLKWVPGECQPLLRV